MVFSINYEYHDLTRCLEKKKKTLKHFPFLEKIPFKSLETLISNDDDDRSSSISQRNVHLLLRSNRNFRFELIRFMRGLNARTFSSPVVFDPSIRHTFLREVCRDLNAFSTNRDSSKRNTTRAKDLSLSRNKRN